MNIELNMIIIGVLFAMIINYIIENKNKYIDYLTDNRITKLENNVKMLSINQNLINEPMPSIREASLNYITINDFMNEKPYPQQVHPQQVHPQPLVQGQVYQQKQTLLPPFVLAPFVNQNGLLHSDQNGLLHPDQYPINQTPLPPSLKIDKPNITEMSVHVKNDQLNLDKTKVVSDKNQTTESPIEK